MIPTAGFVYEIEEWEKSSVAGSFRFFFLRASFFPFLLFQCLALQAIIPLKATGQISLIILLFTSVPCRKRLHIIMCWNGIKSKLPGSTIFYAGIPVVSLRCKRYRASLFLKKVAFVTTFATSSRGYPCYAGYPFIIINL